MRRESWENVEIVFKDPKYKVKSLRPETLRPCEVASVDAE